MAVSTRGFGVDVMPTYSPITVAPDYGAVLRGVSEAQQVGAQVQQQRRLRQVMDEEAAAAPTNRRLRQLQLEEAQYGIGQLAEQAAEAPSRARLRQLQLADAEAAARDRVLGAEALQAATAPMPLPEPAKRDFAADALRDYMADEERANVLSQLSTELTPPPSLPFIDRYLNETALRGVTPDERTLATLAVRERNRDQANDRPALRTTEFNVQNPQTGAIETVTVDTLTNREIGRAPAFRAFPSPEQAGEIETAKTLATGRAKAAVDRVTGWEKAAEAAATDVRRTDRAIQLLAQNPNMTGTGAAAVASLKRAGGILGFDTSEATNLEEVTNLLADNMLSRLTALSGQTSNKDIDEIKAISAGAGKTVEGNLRIMRAYANGLKRNIELGRKLADGRRSGKTEFELEALGTDYLLPKPDPKDIASLREYASDPAAVAQFDDLYGEGAAARYLQGP